jgi:release factor glutamine methyltransferase
MTYLELLTKANKEYGKNTHINNSYLFKVSKKVKNLNNLLEFGKQKIDFNENKYLKLIKDYYINNKPEEINEYMSIKLKVLKGVLIPRPETELLIEKAIYLLENKYKYLNNGIDICAGSGIIGLNIKKKFNKKNIYFNDISKQAISNVKINAKLNNIIMHNNCINKSFEKINKKFDFILCNPPYVKKEDLDMNMLKYEDIRNFTPKNKDHLYFYKYIIKNLKSYICDLKNFFILFEIGKDDKKELEKYVNKFKGIKYKFYKDYSSNYRILEVANV